MDVAPFNIFENQIIPVGLHNLSKSFRPNLTTTRVFSLGTKFIPICKNMKIKKPFAKFEDFRRRMSNKAYFSETTPGTFVRDKNFHIKFNWWANEQYNEIDNFCFKLRDVITNLFENFPVETKCNLSNQEFFELQNISDLKNKTEVINDSDKNLGAVRADKADVITECKRQLYDVKTSLEEMDILIAKIKAELLEVVNRNLLDNFCLKKAKEFLVSKLTEVTIHIFINLEIFEKSHCWQANSCRL